MKKTFFSLVVFFLFVSYISSVSETFFYKNDIKVSVRVFERRYSDTLSIFKVEIKKEKNNLEEFKNIYFIDAGNKGVFIFYKSKDNYVEVSRNDSLIQGPENCKKIGVLIELGEESRFGYKDMMFFGFSGSEEENTLFKEMTLQGVTLYKKGENLEILKSK